MFKKSSFYVGLLALSAVMSFFDGGIAHAESVPPAPIKTVAQVIGAICKAGNVLFTVLMIAGIIVMLVAAFAFMTAGGEQEKISTAKKWLVYGIIGIGIALLAKGIVLVVGDFFDIGSQGLSVCG